MLILSFSGNAENSLTLKSLEVLEHHPEVDEPFEKVLVKPFAKIEDDEWFAGIRAKMEAAETIIWAASPYHMNMPSHMIHFFERCRREGVMLESVNTFFQTNVRVCDHFLSEVLEKNIRSIAKHYATGLSYGSYDMINREMELYLITVAEKPEGMKKGLFRKNDSAPPEFKDGEGITNAVRWYKMLKAYGEYFSGRKKELLTDKSKAKVLFVDTDESPDGRKQSLTDAVERMKSFYKAQGVAVSEIALRDYKVRPCDGCKICYASKVCKTKDDYGKFEQAVAENDIILYYGRCEYGSLSSLAKRFIDRAVYHGLMPHDGILPKDMKKYRSEGFILDCADAVSYRMVAEYRFALCSFDIDHFLGAAADGIPDSLTVEEMGAYSLMLYEYGLMPQRNFYSEKMGHHFSDLSQSITAVIPEEAKYYKKCGAWEPIPVETNAQPTMPDTVKLGAQMRLIPYNKVIESLDRRK